MTLEEKDHRKLVILLNQGRLHREIASELFISRSAVTARIHRLYNYLEVSNTNEAIRKAKQIGWIK